MYSAHLFMSIHIYQSSDPMSKDRGLSLTPKSRDERPLDRRPTIQRYTKDGKMFVPDIVGRVQISVQTVATFTTEEKRLRTAIIASLMLAGRTQLRCVPGVNFDHSNPTSLSLVAQEAVKLGKAPGMHTALSFALLVRDTLANFGQVLKHKGT